MYFTLKLENSVKYWIKYVVIELCEERTVYDKYDRAT